MLRLLVRHLNAKLQRQKYKRFQNYIYYEVLNHLNIKVDNIIIVKAWTESSKFVIKQVLLPLRLSILLDILMGIVDSRFGKKNMIEVAMHMCQIECNIQ